MRELRRFLPAFLESNPPLSTQQRRAIWAITHCRTVAMGGRAYACPRCAEIHFAYHSCNHKACPQCGRQATERWVRRELQKLVNAPYFMVTFTRPANCGDASSALMLEKPMTSSLRPLPPHWLKN